MQVPEIHYARIRIGLLIGATVLCVLIAMPAHDASGAPTTYTVNLPGDGAPGVCDVAGCTLREAIEAANANAGADTIVFAPSVTTVTLTSELTYADATDGLTIDGGNGVTIDHVGAINFGLAFITPLGTTARNGHIRNLGLSNFDFDGFQVCGGVNHVTQTCDSDIDNMTVEGGTFNDNLQDGIRFFGKNISNLNVTGVTADGNADAGVGFQGSDLTDLSIMDSTASNNTSYGIHLDAGDTISGVTITGTTTSFGDDSGLILEGASISNVQMQDVTATNNHGYGVSAYAAYLDEVAVSGSTANDNDFYGFQLWATKTNTHPQVVGSTANGNHETAITLDGTTGLVDAFIDNVTASNTLESGLALHHVTTGATVSNSDFTSNHEYGIDIDGLSVSPPPAASNVIRDNNLTGNSFDGVLAEGAIQVTISKNSTSSNGRLGIDLYLAADPASYVTLNDVGDADTGPNGLLNFPVITGSTAQAVTGEACANCTVELFRSDNDASGYGEGQQFLGDATASGAGSFSISVCGLNLNTGTKVTATATDPLGDTSEFSQNFSLEVDTGSCPTLTPSPTPITTHTATPTPSPSPTATPTPTPTAHTPTPTPATGIRWGDADCDGSVAPRDSQAGLRHFLSQAELSQTQPCPAVGTIVTFAGASHLWGDNDCDGSVAPRDSQAGLKHFLSQAELSQMEPCPDLGLMAPVSS